MSLLRLGVGHKRSPAPAYPLGILALDAAAGNNVMKGVWDLRTTAGPDQPYLKSFAVDGTPTGGWYNDTPANQLYPPSSASWSLDRWDLSGAQVLGKGGATLGEFTNCRFNRPGGANSISMSESSVGNYAFTRCHFDGTDMVYETAAGKISGMVNMTTNAYDVSFSNCKFDKAPLNSLRGKPSTVNMEDTFVGTCCLDPESDSHMESLFIESSGWTLTRTLLDVTGAVPDKGGYTGIVYIEAGRSSFSTSLTNAAISRGDWSTLYTMQTVARGDQGSGPQDLTVYLTDCAIQNSSSGYIGKTVQSGCSLTIVASGCVDLDTGVNIDATLSYP